MCGFEWNCSECLIEKLKEIFETWVNLEKYSHSIHIHESSVVRMSRNHSFSLWVKNQNSTEKNADFDSYPKIHVLTWRNQKLLIVRFGHIYSAYIVIVPTTSRYHRYVLTLCFFHSFIFLSRSRCICIIGYDVWYIPRVRTKYENEWICYYVKRYVHTVTVWIRVGRFLARKYIGTFCI